MIRLFGNKKAVSQPSTKRGDDGVRECDRDILKWFQAKYEASNTHAVRCALYAVRDPNFIVTKQSLMKFVQQEEWAEAGGGYE